MRLSKAKPGCVFLIFCAACLILAAVAALRWNTPRTGFIHPAPHAPGDRLEPGAPGRAPGAS
jgi:hypothetical protein